MNPQEGIGDLWLVRSNLIEWWIKGKSERPPTQQFMQSFTDNMYKGASTMVSPYTT